MRDTHSVTVLLPDRKWLHDVRSPNLKKQAAHVDAKQLHPVTINSSSLPSSFCCAPSESVRRAQIQDLLIAQCTPHHAAQRIQHPFNPDEPLSWLGANDETRSVW